MAAHTPRPMRDALRHRDLRLLLGASLVDEVGGWAYQVVLIAYIYGRTGSATWVAVATTQGMITAVLLSGYAGVLADRYDRRRLLIATSLASAVVMAGLTSWVATDGPLWLFPVLGVGMAVVSRPTRPAAGALVPDVVPERDLAAANGLSSALSNLVVLLGPGVGAVLLLVTDSAVAAVAVNAVSFVVAAALFARLRVRSHGDAAPGGGAMAAWLDGVRALTGNRVALVLVLFCALDSAVFGALTTLNLPLARSIGLGPEGYAYLTAAMALGGVLAAGAANRLASSPRLSAVILGGLAVECLPVAAMPLAGSAPVVLGLMVVSGSGMVVVDVLAITALQRDVPRGVLSRVMSSLDAVVIVFIVAASYLSAALLALLGVDGALAVVGLGVVGLCLLGLPTARAAELAAAARSARVRPLADLLGSLDLFDGASRPQLEQLAAGAEVLQLEPGALLIAQGEEADALYVLTDGRLAISADGRALPDVVAPGYVGELGLLRESPRTATVTVADGSRLLRISAASFRETLERTPASRSVITRADERLARTGPPAPTPVPVG